jgi:hypothetical protein
LFRCPDNSDLEKSISENNAFQSIGNSRCHHTAISPRFAISIVLMFSMLAMDDSQESERRSRSRELSIT